MALSQHKSALTLKACNTVSIWVSTLQMYLVRRSPTDFHGWEVCTQHGVLYTSVWGGQLSTLTSSLTRPLLLASCCTARLAVARLYWLIPSRSRLLSTSLPSRWYVFWILRRFLYSLVSNFSIFDTLFIDMCMFSKVLLTHTIPGTLSQLHYHQGDTLVIDLCMYSKALIAHTIAQSTFLNSITIKLIRVLNFKSIFVYIIF